MGGFIHCKHYSGRDMFFGPCTCRAGINPVEQFCGGDRNGWVKKVPCLRTNETATSCAQAEYPTREEADKAEADFKAEMDRLLTAISIVRPAIERRHKETGEWAGAIDCPQCGSPLRWSKSSMNGHIHAHCETKGCVSWME